MNKRLDDTVFFNDEIVFVNKDSGNVPISSDEIGIRSVDININIMNMINNILIKMILKLLFMSELWLGTIDLNNLKRLRKKSKTIF